MLVGRAFQCTIVLGERLYNLIVIGRKGYFSVCQKVNEFGLPVVRYKIFRNGNSNKVIRDYHLWHKVPYWYHRVIKYLIGTIVS